MSLVSLEFNSQKVSQQVSDNPLTILRNPEWRRKDAEGALLINPDDAARLNLGTGSRALPASGAVLLVLNHSTGTLILLNDC